MRRHTRGGYWNVERDRNRQRVVKMLAKLMVLFQLDWILLQETGDYIAEMRRELAQDYWVLAFDGKGQNNTCIVVAKRSQPKRPRSWVTRMTSAGWITVRGGKTPPKWMVSCLLNIDGWVLRLGSIHTPPSVHGKWKLVGPAKRVLATMQHARSEVSFWRRLPSYRAAFVAGDRNNPDTSRAPFSPRWIAQQANADLWYPSNATHHTQKIDGGIGRHVEVHTEVKGTAGSDHHFIVVDVYEVDA